MKELRNNGHPVAVNIPSSHILNTTRVPLRRLISGLWQEKYKMSLIASKDQCSGLHQKEMGTGLKRLLLHIVFGTPI